MPIMRPPARKRTSGALGFMCPSCRLTRRSFASVTTPPPISAQPSPPAPPASGISRLSSRRLISVSGPDAARYLQGAITANVYDAGGGPREGGGFYGAFLNAKGRVLHDIFVYPDVFGTGSSTTGKELPDGKLGDSFLIEADASGAEVLAKHIRRYKLRAKFNVRLLESEEWSVWQAWDDKNISVAGLSELGSDARSSGPAGTSLRDPRLPALGYRILAPRDDLPAVGLDQAPESAYQIRRYLHGIPEGQDEMIREQALPQESNLDVMGGIDFHKGCYVGQELTIRTKHRGVVRKRILPCVLYPEEQAMPSELAYRPGVELQADPQSLGAENIPSDLSIGRAGKKGRSAGKWLRGMGNVGLALCRLEIMTDVVLPGEAASASYNPEDEFNIEERLDGDRVGHAFKVKAFVPTWLRQGLNGTP